MSTTGEKIQSTRMATLLEIKLYSGFGRYGMLVYMELFKKTIFNKLISLAMLTIAENMVK